jgi:hypothetical protein
MMPDNIAKGKEYENVFIENGKKQRHNVMQKEFTK